MFQTRDDGMAAYTYEYVYSRIIRRRINSLDDEKSYAAGKNGEIYELYMYSYLYI